MSQSSLQPVQPLSPLLEIPPEASLETRRMLSRYVRASLPLMDFTDRPLPILGVMWHDDYRRDEAGKIIYTLDTETGETIPQPVTRTIFRIQGGEQGNGDYLLHTFSPVIFQFVERKLWPIWGTGRQGDLLDAVDCRAFWKKSGGTGHRYLQMDFV